MATDARLTFVDQLIEQGQLAAQSILNLLSQQILVVAQLASQQLQNLAGSLGRSLNINFDQILTLVQSLVAPLINNLSASLGSIFNLSSILGGRAGWDLSQIFNDFLASITPAITGLGQHFLDQGLSAVLGAIGGRGFSDIWTGLSQQFSSILSAGQQAISNVVDNITGVVSGVLDASKPHWEQLQDQLLGHGLNVLNSLGQTINDLHGTITGGR
ncbi:unnamed protein product [Didymodactylos carnosus]|uniref:Uncharacterized protein n=1 Tax=Didymodactylos carnosus TaxID=1234261 RepID=A0A814CI33_9BILA|nr:unnamed protein product [Didymodactylos carnosus]CAF3717084.1 unnamed protein product [Didymodactylos carnosus]